MSAITLLEFSNLSQPKLRAAVLNTLVKNVPLMDKIKWEKASNLTQVVPYISELPAPSFRDLNAAPAEVKAQWSQLQETVKILEVDIVVDPVLLLVDSVQNIEAASAEATVKAIGYFVNEKLIEGDDTTSPSEPRGIKKRLQGDGRFNGQVVNATATATELDVSPASGTDAERYTLLEGYDTLIATMGGVNFGGDPGLVFLCNNQVERSNWSIIRRLKQGFSTTKDQFDRTITNFRDVPFIDVGFRPDKAITGTFDAVLGETNQIIGNDVEVEGTDWQGGNSYTGHDWTPVYCVRFDTDYFMGLQLEALRVKNLGQSPDNPHKSRMNIRWPFGFAALQKRSLGVLIGVTFTQGN